MNLNVSNSPDLAYNINAMIRMFRLPLTIILVLFVLCSASCRKSPTPAELALEKASPGSAPTAANVIVVEPPADPVPTAAAVVPEPVAEVLNVPHPAFYRTGLMLVAIILVLFLLSVVLFHSLARRLRQKSFRAHAPTRHADIWASHKPPQFLDP